MNDHRPYTDAELLAAVGERMEAIRADQAAAEHDAQLAEAEVERLRNTTNPRSDVISDEAVLRAARMLHWCGWDHGDDCGAVEPSESMVNAARSALVAALFGVPSNDYVMNGPATSREEAS